MRWTDYLLQFDFDICYVKGKLNKVADALFCYYECHSWEGTSLVHYYIFSNARLDPEHEDLSWERHLEIKNWVIEVHSELAQRKQVQEQLMVLCEHLEECDTLMAAIATAAGPEGKENSSMVL